MNTLDAKQVAIAFMSVIIVLVVFASSVFYNSIEGPLVAACFILLVLVNKDILTYAREVKLIFFIHLLFAGSVLTTGISFYTRQQASLTEAISDASSIVMVSILGLVVYAAFRNQTSMRYQNALIILFAFVILCYCATKGGQRVYGYEGRYVLGIGLLLGLISLYKLSGTRIKNWSDLLFLTTLNAVTLAVLFLYVESRALTISLCCAWGVGLFTLSTRTLYKLVLFVTPLIFCILIQFTAKTSLADLSRYESLTKLFNVAVLDNSNVNTSKAKNVNDEINTTSRKQTVDKPLDVSTVNHAPVGSSRATVTSNEVSANKKVISKKTDGSLGTRYVMLLFGMNEIKETWLFGQGNLGETQLVHGSIGKKHPHIHNQYLSYILAGGILHLMIGMSVMLAPLVIIREQFSFKNYVSTFPLASFILLMFCTTSFLEIDGWRNLFIIYTYVIVALHSSTQR